MSAIPQAGHASTILIVGGLAKQHALKKLKALNQWEFRWIETRESDPSASRFLQAVERPDVAAVILLNGLVRHEHAAAVRELCRKLHKQLHCFWRSANPGRVRLALVRDGCPSRR